MARSKQGPVLKLRGSPPGTFIMVLTIVAWALTLFGVLAFVGEIGRWKEDALAGSTMFAFWGTVLGVFAARHWHHGPHHVRVDMGRGTATIVHDRRDELTLPLTELGELTVVKKAGTGYEYFELHATGVPKYRLFYARDEALVTERKGFLEDLVAQHAIRQILALDAPDGGAFRNDPDLAFRIQQVVPDADRLKRVLAKPEMKQARDLFASSAHR